jgi:mRNA interferase HicA
MNPRTGVIEAIPRHREIKEPLARKILKALDAE